MTEDQMAGLRALQQATLEKLAKRPDYEVGVMKVIKLPRPVPLGICPAAQQATKLLSPIVPTRHAPRGTVRPGTRRRSPKVSTKPTISKGRAMPSQTIIENQHGLSLFAWLRKWNMRLLGRTGSRRRERMFRLNREKLRREHPSLWNQWLTLERAQRVTVLGA